MKEDRNARNDLFPLPLQLSAEDLRWDALACDLSQLIDCPESAVKSAWKHCMIMVLNTWAMTPQSCNKNDTLGFDSMDSNALTNAQRSALDHFGSVIDDFYLFWMNSKVKDKNWKDVLERRLDTFAGMVTTNAHNVTLAQVMPSLPPEGLAGKGSWAASNIVWQRDHGAL